MTRKYSIVSALLVVGVLAFASAGCGGSLDSLDPTLPRVTSVTPQTASPGAWVEVRGNNFTNVQGVYFGNAAAQVELFSATDTYLKCLVPAGSGTVDVQVKVEDSSGNTTASDTSGKDKFTYPAS